MPIRRLLSLFAAVTICGSGILIASFPAGASNISNDRAKAKVLLRQINRMTNEVSLLGQKYDDALIKLHRFNNEIADTKATVAAIEANENKGHRQLQADVIFSYVTNGSNEADNPLFTK